MTCSRVAIVEALEAFYSDHGLRPQTFGCRHREACERDAHPRLLAHGAEAHVGREYGTAMRVVVVSLDTGGGVADLDERTRVIEALATERTLNPHMRGTTVLLSALLRRDIGTKAPYPFFAMINAAKCSGKNKGMAMVPASLYERCREFGVAELALLSPQLVVAQGVRARLLLPSAEKLDNSLLQSLSVRMGSSQSWIPEWTKALASRYLRRLHLSSGDPLALLSPHPAARGGQWQRFRDLDMKPLVAIIHMILGDEGTT